MESRGGRQAQFIHLQRSTFRSSPSMERPMSAQHCVISGRSSIRLSFGRRELCRLNHSRHCDRKPAACTDSTLSASSLTFYRSIRRRGRFAPVRNNFSEHPPWCCSQHTSRASEHDNYGPENGWPNLSKQNILLLPSTVVYYRNRWSTWVNVNSK